MTNNKQQLTCSCNFFPALLDCPPVPYNKLFYVGLIEMVKRKEKKRNAMMMMMCFCAVLMWMTGDW